MIKDAVLMQIRACHGLVKRNVGEITHEESLRSFSPAGNGLNWTLGHLVATRCSFLRGLGAEPVWSDAERKPYDRHSPPLDGGRNAKPLAEIWKAYDLSQERLEAALQALTPERLASAPQSELRGGPFKTLEELITFLGLHDAYHTGQTGLVRRLLGKPPANI